MSDDPPVVPRLVSINRQQLVLRSMDVEKLVDEDHCVRAIWEPVGRGGQTGARGTGHGGQERVKKLAREDSAPFRAEKNAIRGDLGDDLG